MQYHPEAVTEVLDAALACGDMNHEERRAYDDKRLTTDVSVAFKLPLLHDEQGYHVVRNAEYFTQMLLFRHIYLM